MRTIKQKTTLEPKIKWPNDILINGKKLAGILTEMQAEQDQIHYMVIGVGVNINQRLDEFPEDLRDTVTSLMIETDERFKRRYFIQDFLKHFETLYRTLLTDGFDSIKDEWEQHAFRRGETLTYRLGDKEKSGVFVGIHETGALLIKNGDQTDRLYSADIHWFEGGHT